MRLARTKTRLSKAPQPSINPARRNRVHRTARLDKAPEVSTDFQASPPEKWLTSSAAWAGSWQWFCGTQGAATS